MAFQGKAKRAQQQFPSPEELYLSGTLHRTTAAVDGLWLHQGDVIRAYSATRRPQTWRLNCRPDLARRFPVS